MVDTHTRTILTRCTPIRTQTCATQQTDTTPQHTHNTKMLVLRYTRAAMFLSYAGHYWQAAQRAVTVAMPLCVRAWAPADHVVLGINVVHSGFGNWLITQSTKQGIIATFGTDFTITQLPACTRGNIYSCLQPHTLWPPLQPLQHPCTATGVTHQTQTPAQAHDLSAARMLCSRCHCEA